MARDATSVVNDQVWLSGRSGESDRRRMVGSPDPLTGLMSSMIGLAVKKSGISTGVAGPYLNCLGDPVVFLTC